MSDPLKLLQAAIARKLAEQMDVDAVSGAPLVNVKVESFPMNSEEDMEKIKEYVKTQRATYDVRNIELTISAGDDKCFLVVAYCLKEVDPQLN